MEQKRLDLRSLWPALPNLWLLLVTYQEKRPEFENNRYCFVLLLLYCWYCCIVIEGLPIIQTNFGLVWPGVTWNKGPIV